MKKDTRKRIEAYKKALPHMKERVMAVAMLFVISITMMTSATFAWITLSRAPEVNGLATTIATNGNLEIALSDVDGEEPDDTKVGDGGQDVRKSNLAWGNLVNLSDPSYGLESVTLRPAVLNTGSLKTAPLYSVTYGADGRITGTTSDFLFTNYATKDGVSAFYVPENGQTQYGVRAVSSVAFSTEGEEKLVDQMNNAVKSSYTNARSAFQNLYNNSAYMNAITRLAGVYLTYRVDKVDVDCRQYIESLYEMMEEFRKSMNAVETNLVNVANLHHYMYTNQNGQTYTAFLGEDIRNGTAKRILAGEGVTIQALDVYMTMCAQFYGSNENGAYYKIKEIYDEWNRLGDYVGWEELAGVNSVGGPIGVMADIPSATVNGVAAININSENITDVIGYDPNICMVHRGLIVDMDKLLGTQLNVDVDRMPLKLYGRNLVVENIKVSTGAVAPWTLAEDNNAASEAASGQLVARNATAADTYGMAIDFWVRTNSRDSRLILEGEYVKAVVELEDAAGNPLLDENGNPMKEERIVGYQGVNRVWEGDDPKLPEKQGLGTSATQGTGSCYVFYLENPEDRDQCLEMLKAMCVAFVDEDGGLLAVADMDTQNVFEDAGRVLVPLLVRGRTVTMQQEKKDQEGNVIYQTDSEGNTVLDSDGNPVPEMETVEKVSHHITDLNQNEAKRITAILHLDGGKLTNSQVLAAGSIKGQLNIQFGTTEDLVSMDDSDLKQEAYTIDLNIEQVSGDFETYNPSNKPVVEVTVTLDGMDADSMRGNFTSMLSTTQGAKQEPFTLEHVAGTATWKAQVTLNGAGTYQLRSVQIDGVDYAFTGEQVKDNQIVIPGTTVNEVECVDWNESDKYSYMSADAFYNLEVTAQISGTSPRSVKGVFENKDRQNVMITFAPDGGTTWRGKGVFTTSGEYTMTYMIIDDVRVPLLGVDYKTLDLKLGLRTRVFMTQPLNAEGNALKNLYEAVEAMQTLTAEETALAETVIAGSELSEQEKTDLTAAMNAGSLTAEQRKSLLRVVDAKKADVIDQMNNGDPNDPDDGLQMTSSSAGYSFYYIAGTGKELYMDVSCIITDDKGNELTDLANVELQYRIGSSDTGMDADMVWNSKTSQYEGVFQLALPGGYTFKQVLVGENAVTVASSAPFVAANSRDPMEYKGPVTDYKQSPDTVIRRNANREMSILLKYAPSATVKMTLKYTDVDAAGKQLEEFHELMAVLTNSDNENSLYQYTVQVPKDGNWEIVDLQVANVVYKDATGAKVYYDGSDAGTGWVDLKAEVLKDQISRKFFTTVIYNVNKQPNSVGYPGDFMENHIVENMTVTLSDYLGRPVEGAEVNLAYKWNSASAPFSVNSGVTYPNAEFKATKQADGITFAMPQQMNFQLAGNYDVTFSMKINGIVHNFTDFEKDPASVDLKTDVPIKVEWTNLPEVTISKLSQQGQSFALDLISSGKTEDTGDCDNKTTAANHRDSGKHPDQQAAISGDKKSATVYIECADHTEAGKPHNCVPPKVTLTLTEMTGVTKATLSFSAGAGVDVHMYKEYGAPIDLGGYGSALISAASTKDQTTSFEWSAGSGDSALYIGKVSGAGGYLTGDDKDSDTKTSAGTLRSQYLTLTYNGIDYAIPYTGITINNPM